MYGWGFPEFSSDDMVPGNEKDVDDSGGRAACLLNPVPVLQMWRMHVPSRKWERVPHYGNEPSWRER